MNSFLQKCILAAGTCLLLSVGSAAEAESDMTGFLRSSKEFQAWAFVCQPEKGKLSLKKTDANTYRSYLLKVNGGEIRMLHDDPDQPFQPDSAQTRQIYLRFLSSNKPISTSL